MQYISKLVLDISGEDLHQCITAKQGDDKTRLVEITLMDGENQVKLANGESADFRCLKPDNRSVILDATYQASGTILLKLDKQVLAVAGTVLCDVAITDTNGNLLSTANFYIIVEPAATNGGYIPSEDYFKRKSDIDMNNFRIRNLPTPENDDEAVNKGYVDEKATKLLEETEEMKKRMYSSFSNAVKGVESGNLILIDDISPVEHIVPVVVKGKNLCEGSSVLEKNTTSYTQKVNITEPITISLKKSEDLVYSAGVWRVGVYYFDGTAKYITDANVNVINTTYSKVFTATVENPITEITIRATNITAGKYYDIQIELGETPTDYSPHIDPTTIKLTGCGKNLVTYPYSSKTGTSVGVTYTEDGNGKITVSGTIPETVGVSWNIAENVFLKKGTYTLSGAEKLNGIDMRVYSPSKKKSYAWLKAGKKYVTFAVDEDVTDAFVYLNSNARNVTVSGYCLPQLEIGETATAYELYNGVTYTPNADGSCEVVSVSPEMIIFANLAEVTITCEYTKDINKVIETLIQAIISLGGNV